MISFGAGLPNSDLFPLARLDMTMNDGTCITLSGSVLAEALQYGTSYGSAALLKWLKNRQQIDHNPQYPTWDVMITNGSQDALAKVFDMLIDEGDSVLVENPTYSGALGALKPLRPHLVGVECDKFGLVAEKLELILSGWDKSKPRPKVLYTIPTGQNPSGATMSNARRDALYRLAQKFDLLIIEDDPYWNLRFDSEPDLRSLFARDVDGRVLRLDSMSKIVSSGLRVGWASGPKQLIEVVQLDQQVSSIHPSGISMAVTMSILEHWGEAGWQKQLAAVQALYKDRRDRFVACATRHLSGKARWHPPAAGMFLWFELLGVKDTTELVKTKAVSKKVLLVPGNAFLPDGAPSCFVRGSFSIATAEEFEEGFRRFAALLDEVSA
jgi:kynurenine/2-aminoadipate aminotransferase